MTALSCWWCGVEPDEVIELTQFGAGTIRSIPQWPLSDHQHAAEPPTPGQLAQAGHETFLRVVDAAGGQK